MKDFDLRDSFQNVCAELGLKPFETLPLLMLAGGRRLHRVGNNKLTFVVPPKPSRAEARVIRAIQRLLEKAKAPASPRR